MRLWSLHPHYLDTKGLLAVWREALLARKVLKGKTVGYKNHPQLARFKASQDPISAINIFLHVIYDESCKRGFCFDQKKLHAANSFSIPVTSGQIVFESAHLEKKLLLRSKKDLKSINKNEIFKLNPLFYLVEGGVESWEKVL